MLRNAGRAGTRAGRCCTDEEAWTAGYKELTDAGLPSPAATAGTWFDNSLLPKT